MLDRIRPSLARHAAAVRRWHAGLGRTQRLIVWALGGAALLALIVGLVPVRRAYGQTPAFDARLTQACLDQGGWRDCIGIAAQACMNKTPGGLSTAGMVICNGAEADWWDARLNVEYRALMERLRAEDAAWQPVPDMPPRPSGAEGLRAVQRAWIAYRDATCAFEQARWWGGTGASVAGAGCRLRLTAEQVLALVSYQAEG